MRWRFFYLFITLLFSGCAQLPTTESTAKRSWDIQKAQLEQLTHWDFSGKLAFITPEERNSVNIHWQQSGQNFHIYLSTFLGMRLLEIQKNDHETIIIDDDGKRYAANNGEQLITELSGMDIPIEQLQQWIKGNPSNASYQLNAQQQVASLFGGKQKNDLWSITYSDYRTIKNINLPHKLQLTRGGLRLKFSISNWQIKNALLQNLED
ncbi:MAG: lipoprotein insertase outer membrane protein LolB [Psychromonas sp.]